MAKGKSLHIGVNSVLSNKFDGSWSGNGLRRCEADAKAMYEIAKKAGFEAQTILTTQATLNRVRVLIKSILSSLVPGDIFFLSFSGHGAKREDGPGVLPLDEDDGFDEAWVLYDGQLVDDEIFTLLAPYPGVRIVVLADSCHSGTSVKNIVFTETTSKDLVEESKEMPRRSFVVGSKEVPPGVVRESIQRNRDYFKKIQKTFPDGKNADMLSEVLLIAACQDNQVTFEGPKYGIFTGHVINVWNNGNFANYIDFFKLLNAVCATSRRTPRYFIPPGCNTVFDAKDKVLSI